MHLFIELRDGTLVTSQQFPSPIQPQALTLKRRDIMAVDVSFLQSGVLVEYPTTFPAGQLGIKAANNFSGPYWVFQDNWTKLNNSTFRFVVNLNSTTINDAFQAVEGVIPAGVAGMLEIQWTETGIVSSTNTLYITIANDVIQGDEGPIIVPSPAYTSLATRSTVSIAGDTVLTADRNRIIYLSGDGAFVNITLPYIGNQDGDVLTLVAVFSGAVGNLKVRRVIAFGSGEPTYSTVASLVSNGQAVSLISDGTFGGWTVLSVGGNFPTTDHAVQEFNINNVLLPNGDNGDGVQLTRNTATPQVADGSDRTFNAEQLIYRRIGSVPQRLDTYLGVKLEWKAVHPSTPTTAGSTGQIAYSDPYFYICVGQNKWRRAPLAAW